MQYIKLRYQTDEVDLFSDEYMDGNIQPISREDYERLLHDCVKRMDLIFAVTLALCSIGMNSPEGKQIKERLQMLRGYIF